MSAAFAEFDRIANLYDETRRALGQEAQRGIKENLEKASMPHNP